MVTVTVSTTIPSNASAATMAIIAIDVVVVVIWRRLEKKKRGALGYPLKQRVFEALPAGPVAGHPAPRGLAASACCNGIVTATVTATTPSNPSAVTMAITVNVVSISKVWKGTYFLRISATRLQNKTFS